MHSHDRTLLARLGFSDPDKKDPRHDLACQYLALRENQERLAEMLFLGPLRAKQVKGYKFWTGGVERPSRNVRSTLLPMHADRAVLELPVSKGVGQYKTTVGFVDVSFTWHLEEVIEGEMLQVSRLRFDPLTNERLPPLAAPCRGERVESLEEWVPHSARERHPFWLCAEVKVAPSPVGDVLRQVKLYREHLVESSAGRHPPFVLATVYPMGASDVAALKAERITHIRLGPKFDEWVAAREAEALPGDSPEF